jgi:hypothetical protein
VNPWRAVDNVLFGPGTTRRLVATHVGFAAVIGPRIALGPYPRLAGQPRPLFRPLSFVRLLDRMPSVEVIVALQVVGVAAAALAIAGWHRRATFATAWCSLLVLAGLRSSLGKILHNDVLLLIAAAPFLLAPIVRGRGDDTTSATAGWPVNAALVAIALAYFFAGWAKITTSRIDWVTGDNLRYVMYDAARTGRMISASVPLSVADRAWLSHVGAASTLTLELTFPLVLFVRRVRPFYAVWAVVLHVGTWLALGLDYWMWVATVLLVVVDPSYAMCSTKRSSWRRLRHSKTPSQ